MFDQSIVQSDPRAISAHRLITLPFTIAVHAAMVGAGLAANVWVIEFPYQSPVQTARYLLAEPPPPPPPPPAAPPRASSPSPAPVVRSAVGETAPRSIPESIPDLTPAGSESGSPEGSAEGVEGGEAGGMAGGVAGGVVGGVAGPLPVGGDVLAPAVLDSPAPEYPAEALKKRIEGLVRLELVVGADGHVRSARVVASTNALFEKSAVEGVKLWKFSPGTLHGKPVETIFRLALGFQIPGGKQKKSGFWRRHDG